MNILKNLINKFNNPGLNVLSLFDGIACGYEAFDKAKIKIENYWAFEIDKYAIKIATKNHPDIKEMGSVINADFRQFEGKIDILIGGSPCQNLSIAGDRTGLKGEKSKLFYEYVRALKEVKPKYFLFENVASMTTENKNKISEILGVEPILINSALLSAQNRKRLYWTNIKNIKIPEDKGILLKDIVLEHTEVDRDKSYCIDSQYYKGTAADYFKRRRRQHVYDIIKSYIVPFDKTLQILDNEYQRGKIGYFGVDSQSRRVYSIHGKADTLCGDAGGGAAKMGQYLFGCLTPDRIKKRQDGQRFNQGVKSYTLTAQDRHGILTEGYIRKLTPIECERLQTLPDNYTEGISDAQRYKCIGNGWTIDVIAHILKGIKEGNK